MATFDFFSIDLLVKTLFAPFRQISAGHVQGPMAVQLRAFADRLVSRVIGAIVRLIMLVIGVIAIVLQALLAGVILLGWLLVPLLPLVGLMLFIFEVRAPWHL